jgi:LPS sulfotransferase NodH
MFGGPEVSYHQTHSARDWLSILRTPYTTQNVQRKCRTDIQMTTKARKRTKNSGLTKIGVWNVRGLYGKEKLLQEELKKTNVDIAVIREKK